MFTSPAEREIRRSHVIVVQRRQRNVQKSVLHVQSSCFTSLIQLLFCRSHCHCHLGRGCLTSVLVVVMMMTTTMTTTTTTDDDDATTMTTTTTKTMMMMMMISYVSQEHSRAGSNCFWKLHVKVIHYSFTRKQNSISFFFQTKWWNRCNREKQVVSLVWIQRSERTDCPVQCGYGEKCQNSEMFDVDIEWKKPIKVPVVVNK